MVSLRFLSAIVALSFLFPLNLGQAAERKSASHTSSEKLRKLEKEKWMKPMLSTKRRVC